LGGPVRFLRPSRLVVVVLLAFGAVALWGTAAGAVDPLPARPHRRRRRTRGEHEPALDLCRRAARHAECRAAFALVETGFTRKKNAAHTMGMNVAIFGTAFVAFFIIGYPLMFGGYAFAARLRLRHRGRQRVDRQR